VHRVTVLRQLDRVLAEFGARVEALLRARLALAESEVGELVQALRSQLELSLSAPRGS
jgi:hypothetical protein